METNRQKKIAGVLQKHISEIINRTLQQSNTKDVLISVTKVRVTTDLTLSKVYISVFPINKATEIMYEINHLKSQIKHQVAIKVKKQLRKMPDLSFFLDDSLDMIERIERAIEGKENPLSENESL